MLVEICTCRRAAVGTSHASDLPKPEPLPVTSPVAGSTQFSSLALQVPKTTTTVTMASAPVTPPTPLTASVLGDKAAQMPLMTQQQLLWDLAKSAANVAMRQQQQQQVLAKAPETQLSSPADVTLQASLQNNPSPLNLIKTLERQSSLPVMQTSANDDVIITEPPSDPGSRAEPAARHRSSDLSPTELEQTVLPGKRSMQEETRNKRAKTFQAESSGEDSGVPGGSSNEGEGSARPTYNFKKDIKWRFTADKRQDLALTTPSDERADTKDIKKPTPSSNGSSDYMSDVSGSNGRSSTTLGSNDSSGYSSANNLSDSNLTNTVPAFALHPAGVFYVPLVLPVSQVLPFVKHHRSMGVCHPVSIPVSFTGPFHVGIPHAHDMLRSAGSKQSRSKHGTADSGGSQKRASSECPPLIPMKWQ